MKTKFCLVMLFLFSFATLAFSQDQMSMFDEGTGSTNGGGKPRSNPAGFSAVMEEGEYINVVFPANTGTVDVSIENDLGVVAYKRSINTASIQKLVVSIADLSKDSYKIRFVNEQQGESMYAAFTMQ